MMSASGTFTHMSCVCFVTDPEGSVDRAEISVPSDPTDRSQRFAFRYPTDFGRPGALPTGEYQVDWQCEFASADGLQWQGAADSFMLE